MYNGGSIYCMLYMEFKIRNIWNSMLLEIFNEYKLTDTMCMRRRNESKQDGQGEDNKHRIR